MTEQILYTGLLKGAIIGNLTYANALAEIYATQISSGKLTQPSIPTIKSSIIEHYGVLMDQEEEDSFEELLLNPDRQMIINYLISLEKGYQEYFLDIISERRAKVEIVYQDVTERTQLNIKDDEVIAIKIAESNQDYLSAWKVCKQIKYNEIKSIDEFYLQTNDKVNHIVENNSGNEEQSAEIWVNTFTEFRKKLMKIPSQKGYYEWRPIDKGKQKKATIHTFFIGMCYLRWLDFLRKKKITIVQKPDFVDYENLESHDEINDFYEKDNVKFIIKNALEKLLSPCKEIIKSKWFGGAFGDGLSSKESSKEINLSVGYINTNHKQCLDQLREILLIHL